MTSGRGLSETGAHVRGHNRNSIGTCLIGTDRFTAAQWHTLRQHVKSLQIDYPRIRVVGHNELFPGKACPGFDVQSWLACEKRALDDHLYAPSI